MHLDTLGSVDHRRIDTAGNVRLKETGFLTLGDARWLLLLQYRLQLNAKELLFCLLCEITRSMHEYIHSQLRAKVVPLRLRSLC